MHDVLEKYYNSVLRKKDDLLFKTFEDFGYSKAKVYRLAGEGRITAVTMDVQHALPGHQKTIFMVDNTPLFALEETVKLELDRGEPYKMNGELKVEKFEE